MSLLFSDHRKTGRTGMKYEVSSLHRLECHACPLNQTDHQQHPKMFPTGASYPIVYILGEAPSEYEDQKGRHFIGESGRFLRDRIPSEWEEHIRWNNVVRDWPVDASGKNRTPTPVEIECCRPSIERDIEKGEPEAIFGFGNVPLNWALGRTGILAARGRRFPVKIGTHVCWYYPMVHPSDVIRRGGGMTELGRAFEFDLRRAFQDMDAVRLNGQFQRAHVPDQKEIFEGIVDPTPEEFLAFLEEINQEGQVVGVDIETTDLRPYAMGSKILTIAIGTSDSVMAVPLSHTQSSWRHETKQDVWEGLRQFFCHPRCRIVAHNLSFELEWLGFFLGEEIFKASDHYTCTMAQAYILNETKGGMSLDFLVHQYFGFPLKSISNLDRTKLDQTDLAQVLRYNALDTKWTVKLYHAQTARLVSEQLTEAFEYHQQRIPTFTLSQLRGLLVDRDLVKQYDQHLSDEITQLVSDMQANADVKKYVRQSGQEFVPSRIEKVVVPFFRDFLKRKEGLEGKAKGYSTSEDVLERIDHPVAETLLKFRSLQKLQTTYITNYLHGGESVFPDGKVHTQYNHSYVATGRTSSSSPNIQNFPSREHGWVRNIIIPSSGCWLVKNDYGQIEARVLAMVTKDPYLTRMMWAREDIHMEWAEEIVRRWPHLVDHKFDKKTMKAFRTEVKTDFVFSTIYGSTSFSVARTYGLEERDVIPLHEMFWDKYPYIRKWQRKTKKFYEKYGYVECVKGRRRRVPLDQTQIYNSSIQGSASDIAVDAMVRLYKKSMERDDPCLQAVIDLHDDLTFDVPTKQVDTYIPIIVDEMLATAEEEFCTVPLSVETLIGKTWGQMEEFGTFYSHEEVPR